MTTYDYFLENDNKIFRTDNIPSNVLSLFTESNDTVVNYLNLQLYEKSKYQIMYIDTPSEVDLEIMTTLSINQPFLEGISKAIKTDFNPLELDKKTTQGVQENIVNGSLTIVNDDNRTLNNTVDLSNQINANNTATLKASTFDSATLNTTELNTSVDENTTLQTGTTNVTDDFSGTRTDTKKDTSNMTNDVTEVGFNNIDYTKSLSQYYTSKEINLYDSVISIVTTAILSPLYDF